MNKEIPSFSIKELFEKNDSYVIPIYQRNYTWGQGEIMQLIQDISDYAFDEKKNNQSYYIGTLVVYERIVDNQIVYETIDGQQRLTTLNILLNAFHRLFKSQLKSPIKYRLDLSFDSRKKSTDTLEVINQNTEKVFFSASKEYNGNIKQRYYDAEKLLNQFLDTDDKINVFYSYLTNNVKIVRVSVPEETDLNHYFEIMNNRGEQLEKHEILKAQMLEIIHEDKKLSNAFNLIWEACSDMERYVQYGFTPKERDLIFTAKNWNILNCNSLEEIADKIHTNSIEVEKGKELTGKEFTIFEIIDYKDSFELNSNHLDEAPERFTSVINFSNFLLHVLRIQTKSEEVSLDDKRLIDFFKAKIQSLTPVGKIDFVKDFGYSLLKTKHLFDQFIIKREFIREKEQWSLKRLKWYDGNKVSYVNSFEDNESLNKELIMLLSMFHVSTPTLVYKHWLNASLFYLFYEEDINALSYKKYLQNLAEAYVFDRYVTTDVIDYFNIIYINNGNSVNKKLKKYNLDLLDKGTAVENFIFNYLDYILWKQQSIGASNFEFTQRSSVEHYYPQNPISPEHKIDRSIYDLFGNLCLISSSKNSRLSNHMPTAKKDFYNKVGTDSLKQDLMMDEVHWVETEIKIHGDAMKDKFENFNNSAKPTNKL
ncbi:DUF262 domain-containing protein [Flavobacterium sp. ACAM 123]|jgi:uncharacterized protein with ParB-like and HNH nuclease domain|uniref:GmrSD restriction endonuclease domain-containing protein n=1 Tax=Flavobacterium sp. ACAM 123 TaxID=1189620 RepID=UPI000319B061|nr:DUF262 domain-containing protein [Flavobacterium sp. ACAM 123]